MRILHINLERGWRGGERQTIFLMNGLRDLGYENHIFARKNNLFVQKVLKCDFKVKVIRKPFVFDDVLDLSIASRCGLRFLIRRKAGPLFERYVKEKGLCDYISANSGSHYGVREVCELVLGMLGVFSQVVDERVEFGNKYHQYLSKRSDISPAFYTKKDGTIVEQ